MGLNLDYDILVFAWNGLGLHLESLSLGYDLSVFAWNGLNFDYDILEGLNHDYDLLVFAWNGLTLHFMHASCELLAFEVDHAYTPLMGSSGGLQLIQETNLDFHTK